MFTICVLLYGDHPALARRCLESLLWAGGFGRVVDFRIGLNAVSAESNEIAYQFARRCKRPCHIYEEVTGKNVLKYPMMRRMIHDVERPPASRIMWFDDDSYLKMPTQEWWDLVAKESDLACVLGSIYTLNCAFRPAQQKAIRQQRWYAGKNANMLHKPTFVTGGWWVARTSILTEWDYPFPEIANNGGDSIFGELCRQQGYSVKQFNTGVAINYNNGESKSKRRGETTPWPWQGPTPTDLHAFDVRVRTFLPSE